MRDLFLQPGPGGEMIGKDPKKLTPEDWQLWSGHRPNKSRAIREKCQDCVHSDAEVRKCVQIDCALWPFRMGKQPQAYRPTNVKPRKISEALGLKKG